MTDKRKISLQSLTTSRFGIAFALAVARYTPRWLGYWIARTLARVVISRKDSEMMRALRANQWVVRGCQIQKPELDQVVKKVVLEHTRCLYDLYRNLDRPQEVLRLVQFSADFQALFDRLIAGEQSALLVAPHMSNFDLAGRALALRGLKFQILTWPQTPGGYQWQNRMRSDIGMEATPMSISAVQKAKERLRRGGIVITGFDRPLEQTRYKPRFFGRPAPLPTAYVHLAMQTGAPIYVVACTTLPDKTYEMVCRPAVHPQPHPDRETELIHNTEQVLSQAEVLIGHYVDQWAMFYPVWPEALEECSV